jgi:hypothetical protein
VIGPTKTFPLTTVYFRVALQWWTRTTPISVSASFRNTSHYILCKKCEFIPYFLKNYAGGNFYLLLIKSKKKSYFVVGLLLVSNITLITDTISSTLKDVRQINFEVRFSILLSRGSYPKTVNTKITFPSLKLALTFLKNINILYLLIEFYFYYKVCFLREKRNTMFSHSTSFLTHPSGFYNRPLKTKLIALDVTTWICS